MDVRRSIQPNRPFVAAAAQEKTAAATGEAENRRETAVKIVSK